MSVHQKLGIILESKVVQKLNLEKNILPKMIFLNKISFFASTILVLVDEQ